MIKESAAERISLLIREFLSSGLTPDVDTSHFIKSAYGAITGKDIFGIMENGDDGGAILNMISYPSDTLRESVERIIPSRGFSQNEIDSLADSLRNLPDRCFIVSDSSRFFLPDQDTLFSCSLILKRLNLDISLEFIPGNAEINNGTDIFKIRALLRKLKFISSTENSLFIGDLVSRYYPAGHSINTGDSLMETAENSNLDELLTLVEASAAFFNGAENKPYDILASKKYYYENAIGEAEEFARMLKTYSMEFIMMKRIQPPLVSADEALRKINIINRLTSIVYRMIIPSVNNVFH